MDTRTSARLPSEPRSIPEPVPFEEVAAILDEAAMRARGGPPYMVPEAGWHLAAALNDASFHILRTPADARQLTL